jgi:hypothetical protein
LIELAGRDVCVAGARDLEQRLSAAREGGLKNPREDRLERLIVLPLGVLRSKLLDPVDTEEKLKIQGLLGPERAVVVERGDAFGGRDKFR